MQVPGCDGTNPTQTQQMPYKSDNVKVPQAVWLGCAAAVPIGSVAMA